MTTTLSIREIYDAARSAGFTPHQAVTWTAIAMAESGGRTGALNDKGEYSVGLWQINVNADSSRASKWGDLGSPEGNARAAYAISLQGRDMRPWTTTHDRNEDSRADYRTYLGQGGEGDRGRRRSSRGAWLRVEDALAARPRASTTRSTAARRWPAPLTVRSTRRRPGRLHHRGG